MMELVDTLQIGMVTATDKVASIRAIVESAVGQYLMKQTMDFYTNHV